MNDLVYLTPNTEEPFTTSEVIAECAGVKRDTVQKLVQRHEKTFVSLEGSDLKSGPCRHEAVSRWRRFIT